MDMHLGLLQKLVFCFSFFCVSFLFVSFCYLHDLMTECYESSLCILLIYSCEIEASLLSNLSNLFEIYCPYMIALGIILCYKMFDSDGKDFDLT